MIRTDDTIFLLGDDQVLQRVPNVEYETEDLLQTLIEKHPELIVGDQIDPESPPRWIMVAREAGIPDDADKGDRWSIDHLLLDQFGIPTFIEVKRSSDTRIRREVVGQILDYAANAIVYWPADRLRVLATEQHDGSERLDEIIASIVGFDADEGDQEAEIERYWETVESNLRAGNVRLLFVADEIPRELRRIIEFLNEKMSSVEVLGVEIRQYRGEGISALVPRVVGQTESARDLKASPARQAVSHTNRAEFLSSHDGQIRDFWADVIEKAEGDPGWTVTWGRKELCLRVIDPVSGKLVSLAYSGRDESEHWLWIYFEYVNRVHPAATAALREVMINNGMEARGKWSMSFKFDEAELDKARSIINEIWRFRETIANQNSSVNRVSAA